MDSNYVYLRAFYADPQILDAMSYVFYFFQVCVCVCVCVCERVCAYVL